MERYNVYVKITDDHYIIAVNSSAFLIDATGWSEIDSGTGDKYHHAQGNYFPLPLMTMGGAYRYKLVNSKPVECTPEEIAEQEEANQSEPMPSQEERIKALETGKADQTAVDELNEALNMILTGVTE